MDPPQLAEPLDVLGSREVVAGKRMRAHDGFGTHYEQFLPNAVLMAVPRTVVRDFEDLGAAARAHLAVAYCCPARLRVGSLLKIGTEKQ